MPYITNADGSLTQVTQEQFDIYTIGQNQSVATATTQPSAANIAAGGTVTQTDSTTATILTPNTTNTSPGQTLDTVATPAVTASSTTLQQDIQNVATVEAGGTVAAPAPVTDLQQQIANVAAAEQTNASAAAVDPNQYPGVSSADLGTTDTNATASAAAVDPNQYPGVSSADLGTTDTNATNTGTGTSADSAAASANIQGLIQSAQNQQTIADQRKQINNGDWRVRLRLAPQSNYLYNAPTPGILAPLKVTDGIIFPYTPAINTSYRANYSNYDLTHSNYRGYFYQNSYVDAVNLTATFTAQDTNDANYLLAVIHFLRSATKMFYGQDAQRGSPPPVVYLSGFGDYQFREHSCLISQFTYNLPADVDYIRAGSPNNSGLNFNNIRDRQSVATNSIFGSLNRLAAAFLPQGGITGAAAPPTLGLNRPTYVPTKMEIQLTLLPIQSRQQVSKQFSLEGFANGDLLKGGFW